MLFVFIAVELFLIINLKDFFKLLDSIFPDQIKDEKRLIFVTTSLFIASLIAQTLFDLIMFVLQFLQTDMEK